MVGVDIARKLCLGILTFALTSCTGAPGFPIQMVEALAVSDDGNQLAFSYVNSEDGKAHIYTCSADGTAWRELATLAGTGGETTQAAPMLSPSIDPNVCLDVASQAVVFKPRMLQFAREDLRWMRDGSLLGTHANSLYLLSSNGNVQWWLSPSAITRRCPNLKSSDTGFDALALYHFDLSPDEAKMAFSDGLFISTAGAISTKRVDGYLHNPAWSPDGGSVAYVSISDSKVKLLSLDSGQVSSVNLSIGGQPAESATIDWNATTNMLACQAAPDGTGTAEPKVLVFRPDGQVVKVLSSQVPVDDLRFSPDGKKIYTIGNGDPLTSPGSINVIDIATGSTKKLIDLGKLPIAGKLYVE